MSEARADWRERKKAATRERIRECALRLFREQGFGATTVEQIATAAGVSHMTFFRYFPTKEDVAMADSFDPVIVERLEKTPPDWPVIRRVREAMIGGLADVYAAERDSLLAQNKLILSTDGLRERVWAAQMTTQRLILAALGSDRFADRAAVAACLAAAGTAILAWVEGDGTPELPDLLERAFDALGPS